MASFTAKKPYLVYGVTWWSSWKASIFSSHENTFEYESANAPPACDVVTPLA